MGNAEADNREPPVNNMGDQQEEVDEVQLEALDVQETIKNERIKDAKQVAEDMQHINEMAQDLNQGVKEDQENLDTISQNIDTADASISSGTEDLSEAVEKMKSVRRKKCICAIITLVVLAVIGVVIY